MDFHDIDFYPRMSIADQSQIMLWLPGILVAAAIGVVVYRAFKYS